MHCNKGTHLFPRMKIPLLCNLSYSCTRELTSVNRFVTMFVQRKKEGNEGLRQNIIVIVLFLFFSVVYSVSHKEPQQQWM